MGLMRGDDGAAAGGRVTDLEVDVSGAPELIVPAETQTPRKGEVMFLSNLDQVVLYPIETVYFFPAPGQAGVSSTEGVVERLRHTLRQLLVPYDFMAGRMRLNKQQHRLELLCNNAGVLFAGASAGVSLSDIGDVTLPNPGFGKLVLQIRDATSLSTFPLTTVQMTCHHDGLQDQETKLHQPKKGSANSCLNQVCVLLFNNMQHCENGHSTRDDMWKGKGVQKERADHGQSSQLSTRPSSSKREKKKVFTSSPACNNILAICHNDVAGST